MITTPNRRWFRPRYSLSTLFVVVTAVGIWLGYGMYWIRARNETRSWLEAQDRRRQEKDEKLEEAIARGGIFYSGRNYIGDNRIRSSLPWLLWVLRETPQTDIYLIQWDTDDEAFLERKQAIQKLFPESMISVHKESGGG